MRSQTIITNFGLQKCLSVQGKHKQKTKLKLTYLLAYLEPPHFSWIASFSLLSNLVYYNCKIVSWVVKKKTQTLARPRQAEGRDELPTAAAVTPPVVGMPQFESVFDFDFIVLYFSVSCHYQKFSWSLFVVLYESWRSLN